MIMIPTYRNMSLLRHRMGRPSALLLVEAALSLLVTSSAFVAVLPPASASAAVGGRADLYTMLDDSESNILSCSSNSTHCGWIDDDQNSASITTMDEARLELFNYLSNNLMPYDVPIAQTLGYMPDNHNIHQIHINEDGGNLTITRIMSEDQHTTSTIIRAVDGLSDGIVNQTIYYSLQAKEIYPWTDIIPKSIYMEYVVPYAVVNEPRTDHRPLLFHALRDILKAYERRPNVEYHTIIAPEIKSSIVGMTNIEQTPSLLREQMKAAVKLINKRLWSIFGRRSNSDNNYPITFKAGLTPRIYDPLSVIAYGHSSCTGLAILFIAALRSVGIPSRLAGTPAWNNDPEHGNHSWLEVYIPGDKVDGGGGEWIFLEPTPGIAEGREDTSTADDLDRNACDRWFCNAEHFDGKTQVFVTRYTKQREVDTMGSYFRMAWSDVDEDTGVPGEDRSDYYTRICGQCPH